MRIADILFLVILGIVVFSSCESPRKTKNGRALEMSDSSGLVVQCRKALEPIVIDGHVNEIDWKIAQPLSNFRLAWAGG